MTAKIEKDNTHCLLCDTKVGLRNSIDIFGDTAQTNSDKSLVSIISSITEKIIDRDNAHSLIVCKKCVKLLNEAEELETRLADVKLEISNLFNQTINKKLVIVDTNGEEHIDHDYVDNIESIEAVVHLEKVQVKSEPKRKVKKVVIIDPSTEEENKIQIAKADVITDENQTEYSEDQNDIEEHMDDNYISTGHMEADSEEESPFEEVVVEQDNPLKLDKANCDDIVEFVAKDNYVCLLCEEDNRESKLAKEITVHMRNVHDVRLYVCDMCGDYFRKRTELSAHLDEHVATEVGDFQCETCNRIFNNLRLFRIHKRIHYPQAKTWSCEACGKRYSSKNLLDEHMNTHTGNRPYICEVCGKDFASKYTHRAHVKTHEIRARPHECDQCSKSFLSHQNLVQHLKTHTGVKEHVCHQCGKAFGSAHNLEVHNIVHTGHKPYICRVCGKAFARKAEIRDHERTHTGEKPYQCEFCGSTFSQRSNLQSHKRATHYNDKRYKCEECGKGFKRRRLLDYHIKAAHTGERPYKCETCAATFVYPEHFKKHMRIHTGEKPYLCEVCGKAFNSRDNRNAHRFIHSDKKPYECLVCGMGFMRKPLLYTHMQTQGHLNDTIVVNQPRLTVEDNVILDNGVHVVMDGDGTYDEDAQLIVTELKDHVIIQDGDQQKVISLADGNLNSDDISQLVADGRVTFENSNIVQCKTEVQDTEEIYGYQDEEGNTIVLPPGADIKEIITDKTMRLVQIQIPSGSVEQEKTWLSLVDS